jgi:hypothetical protein
MKSVIAAMLLWIGANTSYDVDLVSPHIELLPKAELEQKYSEQKIYGELHGFYSAETNTIYLPDTFNIHDAWQKGVLLHELIHYVQDKNNLKVQCYKEYEREAYPLQQKYLLEMHGLNWNYDEMWYKLISTCTPY